MRVGARLGLILGVKGRVGVRVRLRVGFGFRSWVRVDEG